MLRYFTWSCEHGMQLSGLIGAEHSRVEYKSKIGTWRTVIPPDRLSVFDLFSRIIMHTSELGEIRRHCLSPMKTREGSMGCSGCLFNLSRFSGSAVEGYKRARHVQSVKKGGDSRHKVCATHCRPRVKIGTGPGCICSFFGRWLIGLSHLT